MDAVLGESEQQIHHREREQDARADEDPPHRSVGEVRVGHSLGGSLAALLTAVSPLGEGDHVGEADPAVAASGELIGLDLAVVEEASDEGPRQPEEVRGFGGVRIASGGNTVRA